MTEFARDDWAWWQKALAAPKEIGSDAIPLHAGADPFMGFYRMRTHKDGPFVPVRIWYADGALKCRRGQNEVEDVVARGMWSYAAKNPISYEHYTEFMKTGVWHDEVKVGEGEKASSSHVGKPAAEKPKRAARANPETATASESEVVQQAEDEKPSKDDPDADHRTAAQKEARHPNGHDRYDRFGNEVDDWGDIVKMAVQVRAEMEAQGEAKNVETALEDEGGHGEQASTSEAQPVRYWHHNATDRIFASAEQPDISGIVVEISREEYDSIAATHADQGGFDLAEPTGDDENDLEEGKPAAEEPLKGDDEKVASADEPNERAVIGDNSGADPFKVLLDEIGEWTRTSEKLLKAGVPKDKASADKLADAKTKLGDLWKEAEAMRVAEKKPHDDAGKAVQAKFKPILDDVADVGLRVVKVLKPYLDEQQRIEDERVEAENKRRREEAEAEAAKKRDFGDDAAAPDPVAEVKARKVGVGNRRTVSTAKRKVAVIVDAKLAAAYFASQNPPHPDFIDVMRKLGHKVMTAAGENAVPGMKLVNEESVR